MFKDNITDEYYFIEFKSGNIDYKVRPNLKFKIYDSLLMFLDIINETVSFSRKQVNYILVYDDRIDHRAKDPQVSSKSSPSLNNIKKYVAEKGNTEIIHFDLDKYKSLYFKNVHTYSFKEFEDKFVSKFEDI